MFRCGELVISLESDGVHYGKERFRFEVTRKGEIIAKGDSLACPIHWTRKRVAEEVVVWMIYAESELRAELGWTFNPDDIYGCAESYDTGSETRFVITETRGGDS